MNEHLSNRNYMIQPTLDRLKKRLKRGTVLRGRVVDIFSSNRILLRVHGYNILTEARGTFMRCEELDLVITRVIPRIEFQVLSKRDKRLTACHVVDMRL
ncbi:MAG: hypothetical protein ACE5D8_01840 [Fidelibacterota bacterium]